MSHFFPFLKIDFGMGVVPLKEEKKILYINNGCHDYLMMLSQSVKIRKTW